MAEHRCDHYTRRPGIAPLCQRVAAALAGAGITVDPDEGVVIAGGARETRFVALRTLAENGRVYVPAGRVDAYRPAAMLAGATLTEYRDEEPFAAGPGVWIWQPDTPVNIHEIDAAAVIVADTLETAAFVPAALSRFADLGPGLEQLLVLGDFGEDAGLDAWNVTWFAGPNPLTAKVRTLKQAMTICTPAPGQYAALAVLEGAQP
jgi:aspartate/methionine/tyrosine aminotransferase